MQNVIEIECPSELLIGLNANAEAMALLDKGGASRV
jgi:hypothetical protein